MESPKNPSRLRIPQSTLRAIFWMEVALATMTALLTVAAISLPDWIEKVLGVVPDGGNGTVEWQMVLASTLSTLVFAALAVHSGRRLLMA